MKFDLFGKKIAVRKEYMVVGVLFIFAMLTLLGWYLKTNGVEVFHAGDRVLSSEIQTYIAREVTQASNSIETDNKEALTIKTTASFIGGDEDEFNENGLVNINTAGVDELIKLYGIGKVKSEAIIAYRNENGSFSSIDEIMNVKGIGEVTFLKIKGFITVGK